MYYYYWTFKVFEIGCVDADAPSTSSTKSMSSTFVRLELIFNFINWLIRASVSFELYHWNGVRVNCRYTYVRQMANAGKKWIYWIDCIENMNGWYLTNSLSPKRISCRHKFYIHFFTFRNCIHFCFFFFTSSVSVKRLEVWKVWGTRVHLRP